jgi:hypothetical protein
MADIIKLFEIGKLATKSARDANKLNDLLYEAGVMGQDSLAIVDSFVGKRTLELERAMKATWTVNPENFNVHGMFVANPRLPRNHVDSHLNGKLD